MVWEALWPFTKHSLVCKELFHLQPHLTTSAVWAHTPTQQPPFPGCHGDHPRQWTGKSVPVRVGGWDSGDHQPAFSGVQKGLEPSRESLQASCLCPPRLWSLPLAGPVTESREWPLVGAENSGSRSRGSPAHPYSMPKHPLHPNLMLGVLSPLCPSHAVRDLPEAPPPLPCLAQPCRLERRSSCGGYSVARPPGGSSSDLPPYMWGPHVPAEPQSHLLLLVGEVKPGLAKAAQCLNHGQHLDWAGGSPALSPRSPCPRHHP